MYLKVLVFFMVAIVVMETGADNTSSGRGARKLFGGYRITPKFCKPTRTSATTSAGPSICMFNHECIQRNGAVVGACMDGFLFGACCQLPDGFTSGDLESDVSVASLDNDLHSYSTYTHRPMTTQMLDITSSAVSKITASLLQNSAIPTAQDNAVVQVNEAGGVFSTTGVTHPDGPDTIINHQDNEINPGYFKPTTQSMVVTPDTPIIHISISNAPVSVTQRPEVHRPMFQQKPSTGDQYVRVPTITHDVSKPNKTQEYDSIVNILQMLNQSTTVSTGKPPSTSYLYSSTPTRRPVQETTTKKPPSTSYVFSTTVPPRRTTTKKPPRTKKPTKTTTTTYVHSSTFKPIAHSTMANSPSAFYTSSRPSTYVYSPVPTSVNTHVAGPGFSVTSKPGQYSTTSPYPSPAPTLIVLGPVEENEVPEEVTVPPRAPTTPRPPAGALPQRKPVNQIIINNQVTQNIYSSTARPVLTSPGPSPTVIITPKPSVSSSVNPPVEQGDSVIVTAADDQSNFPPVRNPNLNMTSTSLSEEDINTPTFVEDPALDTKMESFVNQIIIGLQEPFEGLKDVVYNRNKTTTTLSTGSSTTTRKPTRQGSSTTTRRTTTRRPSTTVRTTRRPTTVRSTTPRTTTRRPTSSTPTRRQTTTTKRTRTTSRPISSTQNLIESTEANVSNSGQYRNECGIRPLLRNGRIVGGRGATFGEFPWQVLVREATWFGLFTKNKCGGVLISEKFVMTAAHCQPGFLASLVAVFGEFDISGDLESRKPVSRNVKRVIVHRKYDAATFENDLALLELESPVQLDAHIIPICLPREHEDFTGRMATVTGWGRLKYGGGVPSVLQEVQVPVMENHVCQDMFRTAGHSKVIMESFLCAGYANGQKDSCEGDSGGPLVLQRPDGRYQLVGTVSHGIKCAAPYLPGVYMRTTFFKPWITSITGIQ